MAIATMVLITVWAAFCMCWIGWVDAKRQSPPYIYQTFRVASVILCGIACLVIVEVDWLWGHSPGQLAGMIWNASEGTESDNVAVLFTVVVLIGPIVAFTTLYFITKTISGWHNHLTGRVGPDDFDPHYDRQSERKNP